MSGFLFVHEKQLLKSFRLTKQKAWRVPSRVVFEWNLPGLGGLFANPRDQGRESIFTVVFAA